MQKVIWVVGCPRSGTSFLTDYIGSKTDYCFNEPWDKYPINKPYSWGNLPQGNIVFKYCSNCFFYNHISKLYPNSRWIHIIRDPTHVLYSMVFPKETSNPKREWKEMGMGEDRIIKSFKKWQSFLKSCSKIKEAKIVKYENIDYKEISEFIEIDLDEPKFADQNKIFDEEKMKYLKNTLNKFRLSGHLRRLYL